MPHDYASRIPIKRIAMIDGKQVEYDFCCEYDEVASKELLGFYPGYEYLGTGYIYSIDGVLQKGSKNYMLHFWKRK